MLRPLGTLLTSAAQLDDAPWQAVLLSSPRLLRTTKPLPYPWVWFRTSRTASVQSALDPTPIPLVTSPQLLHHLPDTPTAAFVLTPNFPAAETDRLLQRLTQVRWAFVRLDNWDGVARTGFLSPAPRRAFPPAFCAQVLRQVGPSTPVLVTRRTLAETVHDLGLLRLWEAYQQQRAPLPSLVHQRIAASLTERCPRCPGVPLVQQTCPTCATYWGVSAALLSPYGQLAPWAGGACRALPRVRPSRG